MATATPAATSFRDASSEGCQRRNAVVAGIREAGGFPPFLQTASGDVDKQLKGAVDGSKHPNSTTKIYGGTEHGLPMFARNADLEPALVGWLKMELVGKYTTRQHPVLGAPTSPSAF